MKLLIISSPGGSGHVQVANALAAETANHPAITAVQHINIASFLPNITNTLLFETYNLSARFFPFWWRCVYTLTNNSLGTWCCRILARTLRSIHTDRLKELDHTIATFQPDWILCTHPVQRFLLNQSTHIHIGMVFTDYDAHAAWIQNTHDTLFVPTSHILSQTIKKGTIQNQCIVSGIPVHPVFFEDKNIHSLQQTYHINPNQKTILVLTGGLGLYDPTTYITALNQSSTPLTIIVITGKNTSLQQKLTRVHVDTRHTYQVVGWTDHIDEYMRIADCIITKPGGITVSECLTLQKQMILVSPIPGQEEANCRFLCHIGAAVYAKKPADTLKYLNAPHIPYKKSLNASQVILNTITYTTETN